MQMLVENITETKCNVLCLLPWLLESMQAEAEEAQDECIYKLLAGMRAVTYAAAALNERVGDALHRKGVVLINGYGSSEAGLVAANQYNRHAYSPALPHSPNSIYLTRVVSCRVRC
jgi:acyl-coenzyme A synthetase/AMP-(fatty) acid ligase